MLGGVPPFPSTSSWRDALLSTGKEIYLYVYNVVSAMHVYQYHLVYKMTT
jgi:hypothetical protein